MGGFINDLFKGAIAHGKDAFGKIKDDPERAFLGALTPIGSELWGGVLGKDYAPAVSLLGGATDQQFADMEAQGINTGPKRIVDGIADAIASFYAGGALGKVGGKLGGGAPIDGGFMSQVDTGGGGFMGQVDTGGIQAGGNPFKDMLRNMELSSGRSTQTPQVAPGAGPPLPPLPPLPQMPVPNMLGGGQQPFMQVLADSMESMRAQEELQRKLNEQRVAEHERRALAARGRV